LLIVWISFIKCSILPYSNDFYVYCRYIYIYFYFRYIAVVYCIIASISHCVNWYCQSVIRNGIYCVKIHSVLEGSFSRDMHGLIMAWFPECVHSSKVISFVCVDAVSVCCWCCLSHIQKILALKIYHSTRNEYQIMADDFVSDVFNFT